MIRTYESNISSIVTNYHPTILRTQQISPTLFTIFEVVDCDDIVSILNGIIINLTFMNSIIGTTSFAIFILQNNLSSIRKNNLEFNYEVIEIPQLHLLPHQFISSTW